MLGHAWVTIGDAIVGESSELLATFAAIQPSALEGYATRDGIHWIHRAPQESETLVSRLRKTLEGNDPWTLRTRN